MSKKKIIFAENSDEPTALANYSGKPIPVLYGDVAERFERMARENEEKAREMENKPLTVEEAKSIIGFKKIILKKAKEDVIVLEKEIKTLENIINKN